MILNYLKIAIRQIWRNRLFTTLNVVGLSIGISACWVIYQIVSFEFSYDTKIPNKAQIYRVVSRFQFEGKESGNAGCPKPFAEVLRKDVPGIDKVVGIYDNWVPEVKVMQSTGKPIVFDKNGGICATTNDYFELIPYKWLAGNAATALSQTNEVVLTNSRAERYFPNLKPEQILGQTIIYWDTLSVKVTGVVADFDTPVSFDGQEFVSLPTIQKGLIKEEYLNGWGFTNSEDQVFLKINENADYKNIEKTLNTISYKNTKEEFKKWGKNSKRWHIFQPLSDLHFGIEFESTSRTVNKNILYGLMGLGLFLLILAIINYVNISTAQVPQRAREIGVRKSLGSSSAALMAQVLTETFFITLLATLLAYGISKFFILNYAEFLPQELEKYIDFVSTLPFASVLIIIVCLLAGLYPSILITRFQPAKVLRGQGILSIGKQRVTLRKSLIVFQFFVAQVFIVGAVIIGQQIKFMLEKDLGFEKEAVITFRAPWKLIENPLYKDKQFVLKNEIAALKEVENVALGNAPMSNSFSSNKHTYISKKDKIERNVYRKIADKDYLSLYKFKLLAGRYVTESDTVNEYVINETAMREFGFKTPNDALGKYLQESGRTNLVPVVGVVKDYHTGSFSQKIEPTAMMMKKSNLNEFNIKLSSKRPADWQAGIKKIEKLWKDTYPNTVFEYEFYDQKLKNIYSSEIQMISIVNLATIVAILIACLGLFGLATLTAFQRTKEIGIRKVLGASILGISKLLSKDFLWLIIIAIVLATPVGWWAMNEFLKSYSYKIDLNATYFVVAGFITTIVALLTVSYQAIRAALANPVKSLKTE